MRELLKQTFVENILQNKYWKMHLSTLMSGILSQSQTFIVFVNMLKLYNLSLSYFVQYLNSNFKIKLQVYFLNI